MWKAHRLSTVRDTDTIIDHGKVVETRAHAEPVKGGVYSMF